jgi:cardiolipin synthase
VNIPNALSLLRIFLVAPFLIAVIYRHYPLALALFVAAGLSDALDGYLARRLAQKSVLGTFLDPLGDRLLTTVAFVALAVQGQLPAWLAVIVVAKDLYVALGAGILHFTGNLPVAEATFWGKLTMVMQIITLGLVLLATFIPVSSALLMLLFVVTGLATTITCVHYILRGIQVFTSPTDQG